MPMTLSGNGTITGLVAGGLPDGSITGSDIAPSTIQASNLGSGAAQTNLGFTPQNRVGGVYLPARSSQSSQANPADLNDAENSTAGKKTWFKYTGSQNSSARYLHIKTNYFLGFDGFWSIKGYGYHYGRAMTINSQWVGYAYSNGGGTNIHTLIATNVSNYGQHALASNSYRSSDQNLVLVADLSANSTTYFIGFELDFYQSTNSFSQTAGTGGIQPTAIAVSANTTGVY
jgi:hypothetical protein